MVRLLIVMVTFLAGCEADQTNSNKQTVQINLPQVPTKNAHKKTLRVVTPDWGIAAELNAMGYPPIASGDLRVYELWSGASLPPETQDLGIRFQPNPEMMAQVNADLVVDNFFYAHIRPMYGDTPVKSINFSYDKAVYTWQDYAKPTQQLGQVIKQPKAAKKYIKNSKQQLIDLGKQVRQNYPSVSKVAVVQFIDANNLRMFAKSSMYQPALKTMGLNLATFGNPNKWGFVPIKLTELSKLEQDTCLLIIKPYSDMLHNELKSNLVWQKYGFGQHGLEKNGPQKSSSVKQRCMAVLEPVWLYGGIASMMSFAKHLVETPLTAVPTQQGQKHG